MIVSTPEKKQITNSQAILDIMRPIYAARPEEEQHKEYMYVIGLDNAHIIKYVDLCAMGTIDKAAIYDREIYRLAIIKDCKAIVLVHNHPSGEAIPSQQDIALTQKINKGCELLGLKLLDHIILAENSQYSFTEKGII